MFDWQTSDEQEWPELPTAPEQDPRRRGWRGLLVGAALLMLIVTLFWIYSQTDDRVDEATLAVQKDVLSSHELLLEAVANQDSDLFSALISGRDGAWVNRQIEQLEQGTFGERRFFDNFVVRSLAGDAMLDETAVTVASDFRAAELSFPVEAVVSVGEGVTETVTLSHTALYRRGATRWLYAPLDDSFWRGSAKMALSRLTLTYPERDADIATALGERLNADLEQLCSAAYFGCDDAWRLSVSLETEPQIWERMAQYAYQFTPNDQLELPTPTLVGLPTDAASEAALQQQYSVAVLSNAASQLAGYDCCVHRNMFKLLVDLLLDEMDIRPFPAAAVDYDTVLAEWDRRRTQRLWGRFGLEPNDRAYGVTLLQYLQSIEPELTTVTLLRSFDQPYEEQGEWISTLVSSYDGAEFETAWEQFVFRQTEAGQVSEPTHPLPQDKIRLICNTDPAALYEYSLRTGEWSAVWRLAPMIADPLANLRLLDPVGLYLINRFDFEDESPDELWLMGVDGREQFLLSYNPRETVVFVSDIHPNGRFVSLHRWDFLGGEGQNIILDLETCSDLGCEEEAVYPNASSGAIWSKDGRYLLYAQLDPDAPNVAALARFNQTVSIVDLETGGASSINGNNSTPAWLDERHVVFLKSLDETERPNIGVVRANVESGEEKILLESADLQQHLPRSENRTLVPAYGDPVSDDGSHLFLLATAEPNPGGGNNSYAFHVRLDTDPPTVSLLDGERPSNYLVVKGAWRANLETSPNGIATDVWLEHELSGQRHTLEAHMFDHRTFWSSSGEWVLYSSRQDQIVLMEPDSGYRQLINHSFGFCDAPHWVK